MKPSKLKILAVVNGLDFGGTERMLERMIILLTVSGRAEFTVCSLGSEGPIGRSLRRRGIEVVALGASGGAVGSTLRGFLGIRRILRVRRFDLIHTFLYRSHCAARLARLSLASRVPLVSSESCLGDNRSRLLLRLNGWMNRFSDRILAVSEAVGSRAVNRDGVAPGRLAVVRNGIAPRRPNRAAGVRLRRALGIDSSEVVFLMLGRLHHEKGADVLLRALAAIPSAGRLAWRAILAGSGPERTKLEQLAGALGISSQVYFAGARRYVDPWIEACDLLVMPSREEGLPVSPLEAMARGKPVIATRVGGSPEVVRHLETGLLVDPEDAIGLARALETLARSPERRAEMGRQGLLRVRAEFSLERMVEDTYRCYQELVEGQSGGVGSALYDAELKVAGE